MNCWSPRNNVLREKLIRINDPDIICLTETHLRNNDKVEISGYQSYCCNRKIDNTRGRGSGGIGILIKNKLFKNYYIENCLELDDAVIGIALINKRSKETTNVYCVYLPTRYLKIRTKQ